MLFASFAFLFMYKKLYGASFIASWYISYNCCLFTGALFSSKERVDFVHVFESENKQCGRIEPNLHYVYLSWTIRARYLSILQILGRPRNRQWQLVYWINLCLCSSSGILLPCVGCLLFSVRQLHRNDWNISVPFRSPPTFITSFMYFFTAFHVSSTSTLGLNMYIQLLR